MAKRTWEAWVETRPAGNFVGYKLCARRTPFSLFRPHTWKVRKASIGVSYYDPSSRFQCPDMPIGVSIKTEQPQFRGDSVEVEARYTYNYAWPPQSKRTETRTIKLKLEN